MNVNLNQLWVFYAVAKSQGFTRAAEELFLTQPGVSKHIKQLEEYYGTPLFDRIGKKVLPTRAGELLLEATTEMFRLLDDKMKIDGLEKLTAGSIALALALRLALSLPEILVILSPVSWLNAAEIS